MISNFDRTACFTGHRPKKLDNCYSFDHPTSKLISKKLAESIEMLINNIGVDTFISGGALGVDQIAFWTVNNIKIKYPNIKNIVAIPFTNQYIKWQSESIDNYNKMLKSADEVINVEDIDKYKTHEEDIKQGYYSSAKMQSRNRFMVDNAKYIIAVWDGSSGGTGNCVKYAKAKSNHIMIILNPKRDFEIKMYSTNK